MIDKKTIDVYAMFNDQLNSVKKELTQKFVAMPVSHPKYAGQAHWARLLRRGIEQSMTVCIASYIHRATVLKPRSHRHEYEFAFWFTSECFANKTTVFHYIVNTCAFLAVNNYNDVKLMLFTCSLLRR